MFVDRSRLFLQSSLKTLDKALKAASKKIDTSKSAKWIKKGYLPFFSSSSKLSGFRAIFKISEDPRIFSFKSS